MARDDALCIDLVDDDDDDDDVVVLGNGFGFSANIKREKVNPRIVWIAMSHSLCRF